MNAEQLEAIRQRAAKATVGPWRWDNGNDRDATMPVLKSGDDVVMDFGDAEPYYPTEGIPPEEADAEFIANARQDIPALLALLDRKSSIITAQREELRQQDRSMARQAARHQRQVDELERTIERLKEAAE